MFDKAKLMVQVMKVKKAIESVDYEVFENDIQLEASGFMAMSEPKIKKLKINGVENKILLEAINKVLKKAAEGSIKKMKDMGEQFQGAV